MLESSVVEHSPLFSQLAQDWLKIFFEQIVQKNLAYYQWIEIVTDWVVKVALRMPFVQDWMRTNTESWEFMIEWFKQNLDVPMPQYQDRNTGVRLNKPKNNVRPSQYRYQNAYRNKGMNFMRRNSLIQIKQGQAPDLSGEVDIDYYHLDDY